MFLFAGLGKFSSLSGFVHGFILPTFAKTWLPTWLLLPYGYGLPFAEVGLGALLLLGVARNAVLFGTGLLLISLTFGQVLLQQPGVVFNNMVYVFLAAGLLFLGEHDRWSFCCCLGKKEDGATNCGCGDKAAG
jgi:thiosulfate dehydrogenase (quinone) large subunit